MKQTDEQLHQLRTNIVRLYGNGKSIRTVADEVSRSYGYVRKILVDARVTLRPRGGHRKVAPAQK
ncbi:helix-turn-helix domain-containing protein [Streptosporangium sp. NPDC049248]|uniref:helix-turn-helix domain-containing protein n=1 Tax=Streptosporangium sp. NPDC049248 TaxID=3155651 RepID=UPI003441E210